MFIDGTLVRQIDQRYVTLYSPETEEVYIGGVDGTLPPGTHDITFRFDSFGDNTINVELTDVEFGMIEVNTIENEEPDSPPTEDPDGDNSEDPIDSDHDTPPNINPGGGDEGGGGRTITNNGNADSTLTLMAFGAAIYLMRRRHCRV